jgi:hypothetical protein
MEDEMVLLAVAGAAAILLASIAWIGDRRRIRRTNPDDVGFMPWTGLFFCALIVALVLLGLAARAWLAA